MTDKLHAEMIAIESKIKYLEEKLHMTVFQELAIEVIKSMQDGEIIEFLGTRGYTSEDISAYIDGSILEQEQKVTSEVADTPESGKVYRLTGGPDSPSIAGGCSWSESEVAE